MKDFEQEFADFTAVTSNNSLISDIYNIIETVNYEQMQALDGLTYYGTKYNIKSWHDFRDNYLFLKSKNKELHFLKSSFISKLAKYSVLDELQRGIKHSQSTVSKD